MYCGIFAQDKDCEANRQLLLGNGYANRLSARQQNLTAQQLETVFSTRPVRYLLDVTIELFGEVLSILSAQRLRNEGQLRLRDNLETAVGRVEIIRETVAG
jgi:hypothetical protein